MNGSSSVVSAVLHTFFFVNISNVFLTRKEFMLWVICVNETASCGNTIEVYIAGRRMKNDCKKWKHEKQRQVWGRVSPAHSVSLQGNQYSDKALFLDPGRGMDSCEVWLVWKGELPVNSLTFTFNHFFFFLPAYFGSSKPTRPVCQGVTPVSKLANLPSKYV